LSSELSKIKHRQRIDSSGKRRYLLVIRFGKTGDLANRQRDSLPLLLNELKSIAGQEPFEAFAAQDGSLHGYLVECERSAAVIISHLIDPSEDTTSAIRPGDQLLVLELGPDWATENNIGVASWLNRGKLGSLLS
jgi:hypothetical protein